MFSFSSQLETAGILNLDQGALWQGTDVLSHKALLGKKAPASGSIALAWGRQALHSPAPKATCVFQHFQNIDDFSKDI